MISRLLDKPSIACIIEGFDRKSKNCKIIDRCGANVYIEHDSVTRAFAELNQELSALIEDKKLTRKQHDLFIKITEQYENCQ